MRVLMISSEAAPFAKSGGLGDVVGSLPKEMKKSDIDVRVIMPEYRQMPYEYKSKLKNLCNFTVDLNWRRLHCSINYLEHDGIMFYFVNNDHYFNRSALYGYFDEAERYIFFSKAVLDAIPKLDFWPDLLHCNDWQTALVPVLLNKYYRDHYQEMKTVYTIHNLKYQGIYGKETLMDLAGLREDEITSDIEFNGDVNFAKGALYNCDYITTVSPTYAEEIKYGYFGEGLQDVLKDNEHKLVGILNGIDYSVFNPTTDPHIYENYTRSYKKKAINKAELQNEIGLPIKEEVPVISIVSRLVEQKGLDLVSHVANDLMQMDIQIVLLGTGDSKYENLFKSLQYRYPEKIAASIQFDEKLAQKIYAGSDMFLMPSRFEPCGLSQLIALRYGTIPIVRRTGGLNDTVTSNDPAALNDTGFAFDNFNAHDMLTEIYRAVDIYNDKSSWDKMFKNALSCKFDWRHSAKAYIKLYKSLT